MNPTLLPGDYIFINRLIPGPRLIPSLFSFHIKEKQKIIRIKGYRTIKHNDVLVFNLPDFKEDILHVLNSYHVKRCIAIPGDTLSIENGIFKVNRVNFNLGYIKSQLYLSEQSNEDIDPVIFNCYPFKSSYNWNVKQFGPLYIPKAGDFLLLDTLNIELYKNLIGYENNKIVKIMNGNVVIGDSVVQNYTFQKNYYFVAGDWLLNSKDSRYWGLLPEDYIVGKVAFVWKSKDMNTGKYRWKRFFQTIN
jgi:signal peptidase I